ncbi:ankyrin repeat domain-containing protein [Pseudomonas sp. MAP12]|uniref:Ankyrin repeat domain-containing protein n=1 Tax=Geopseudomonas aromaticivorans TaxID=2849492 RepID=A0ABS6MVN6_9GAMM|nr:ankyrin repeat domain-containing protein [Pseudomonas aromaticivorans]MBV2132873.1 ankyrin repeat domain-containing protein [Pseudomonas aromaticivorans]
MGHEPKRHATLEEILASASDVLFPAEMGEKVVSISSTDCDGDTPLHVMVWRDDAYAVKVLLAAGAAPNAIGDMGETPLHVAVSKGNFTIADALLRAGAKANIRSELNETAQERAIRKGGEIAKLFAQLNAT